MIVIPGLSTTSMLEVIDCSNEIDGFEVTEDDVDDRSRIFE